MPVPPLPVKTNPAFVMVMIARPFASRMITSGVADSGISWKCSRIERAWLTSSCISACAAPVITNAVSRIAPIDKILALIWHPLLLWLQETSSENLYQALRKNQPASAELRRITVNNSETAGHSELHDRYGRVSEVRLLLRQSPPTLIHCNGKVNHFW